MVFQVCLLKHGYYCKISWERHVTTDEKKGIKRSGTKIVEHTQTLQ